jgi:hypothetical protein
LRDPGRFSRGRTAEDVFEPGEEKRTCRANFDKLFFGGRSPESSPTSMSALLVFTIKAMGIVRRLRLSAMRAFRRLTLLQEIVRCLLQ